MSRINACFRVPLYALSRQKLMRVLVTLPGLAQPPSRETIGRIGDDVLGGDQAYLLGVRTVSLLQHRVHRGGGFSERFLGSFASQEVRQEQGRGRVAGAVDRQREQGCADELNALCGRDQHLDRSRLRAPEAQREQGQRD